MRRRRWLAAAGIAAASVVVGTAATLGYGLSTGFDRAAREVGLPGLTPHELRHTAASLAVSAGANVKAVQRMLGHAKASMTLDVYADLFDDDLEPWRTVWTPSRGQLSSLLSTLCQLRVGSHPPSITCKPLTCNFVGGPGRARTADTRLVRAVLFQLSYGS